MNLHTKSLIALLLFLHVPARSADWRITTGVDYSSGKYGSETDTEMVYVPLTLRYRAFPWTAKLTVPFVEIDGLDSVVGGVDGGVVLDGDETATRKESGLGDLVASLTYSIDPFTDGAPFIDLLVKAKLPTADDEKGLGTGEADYTLQIDLAWSVGAFFPYAFIGYQFLGDPEGSELEDRVLGGIGLDYKLSATTHLGLGYDWRQASVPTRDDSHEVSAYLNFKLSSGQSVNLYTYTGLSDNSPDIGGGLQYSRSF